LRGEQPLRHFATASQADAVGIDLVIARDAHGSNHQVARAGAQMEVDAIPGKVEIAIAIVGQRLFRGDSLPAAVVVGRRGPGRVVAGGEEPVGAELDKVAKAGGIHIARIGTARISRGSLGERKRRADSRSEKQKQKWEKKTTALHRLTISNPSGTVAGKDTPLLLNSKA